MSDMRDERLQIMLSPEEISVLDDFRFKHRMPNSGSGGAGAAAAGLDGNRHRWRRAEIQQLRRGQPRQRFSRGPGQRCLTKAAVAVVSHRFKIDFNGTLLRERLAFF